MLAEVGDKKEDMVSKRQQFNESYKVIPNGVAHDKERENVRQKIRNIDMELTTEYF